MRAPPEPKARMPLTVHHLENSRSQRVLWLLEELDLPYKVKHYARDKKSLLAPPELAAVHPLGKSPVVSDGDVVIAETGAIVEYLLERADDSALRPAPGTPERLRYTYWLHFAEGSAMPQLLLALVFSKVRTTPMPFFARPIARGIADRVMNTFVKPNIESQLAFMEAELQARTWFAGNQFSAADIMMSFPVEGAASRDGLAARYPKLEAFLSRIHARPAYRRALERGGPYRLLS